jgi:tetratricopeptide (TPR) repeat protein
MRCPTPSEYEHWRRQPTIIIDLSVPDEPTHIRGGERDRSVGWLPISACVGVLAVSAFWIALTGEWRASALARDLVSGRAFLDPGPPALIPPSSAGVVAFVEPVEREVCVAEAEAFDAAAAAEVRVAEMSEPEAAAPEPKARQVGLLQEALREGRELLWRRHHGGAKAAYRRALALQPGHPGAMRGLAKVALATGDLDEALHYARRAVTRGPFHAEYHLLLADVLRAHGSIAEAELADADASRLQKKPIDRATRSLPPNPF